MSFIKTFFASCLGSIIALVVVIFLSVVLITAMVSSIGSGSDQVTVEDNSVLQIKLDVPLTEMEVENPLEGLPILGAGESPVGLLQFKEVLKHAKSDSKIRGIYLDLSVFMAGYSSAKEVREALLDFKKSGKWVIAYAEFFTEKSYYVASAADKVYLNPEGELEFNGMAVEVSFYKRLFDKLEIKPEIFRVGDFKSAVEPFFLDKMSDANRLQLNELISDINNHVIEEIAESRKIDKVKLKEISDKMLVTNTKEAKTYGLIDSLTYYDEVLTDFRSRLGLSKDEKISFIKYNKYKKSVNVTSTSKNEIAVIVAEGDIIPGKGQQGSVGSDTFAEELRKARINSKVKAIVLRINSPGGSALASDVMWREVILAAKEKPVIASMSDYAASGGYYLAMGCTSIVAEPNTITGSIGVFSVLFDLSTFLDKKIGITFDQVKTGDIGELATVTRPLTEPEKAIWQRKTNEIYANFTSKAAEGRKMKVEDLRKIASGRVWTGTQAKERGLVDELGGFEDAVKLASEKAGIANDYKLKYYPKHKSFFEQWLGDMEQNSRTNTLKKELGENYKVYEQVKKLQYYQGAQARMQFDLQLK